MSKLVILNLGNGNLLEGFPFVTVQLQEEGNSNWRQFTGSLPASADILDIYRRWQLLYELLYEARSINVSLRQFPSADEDIKLDEVDVTHVSDAEFNEVCQKFQNKIDSWLDSEEFRHIDRQLRKQLAPEDRIRVIIQTEDNQLRKIPWHLWRFFRDYRHAEVGLSALEFGPANSAKNSAKQVRILAILGDRTGIDVEADKKLLEKLPNAQTVFLVEPQRRELDEKLWDKQGWDILFFAGHSSTQTDGETGHIYINRADSLTINQLRNSVSKAIERGLQLAIFNSCDGLGLAQQLDDLHIPQIIVMREPVPDKVAQEFLKHFLREFAEGQSFYLAVREARERLQGIETEFPGASWLPAIVDNPAQMQLTWEKLRDKTKLKETPIIPLNRRSKPKLSTILMASFVVTSLVMGVRSIGWLQSWELQAYDGMMRMRSIQEPDERLLVIRITPQDLQQLHEDPLSDRTVAELLQKLQHYKPQLIGLDIYRDEPVGKGLSDLKKQLEQGQKVIAICKSSSDLESNNVGYQPPPGVPEERLGFSDFVEDKDGIIRRYLFSMNPETSSPCQAKYAFSTKIALAYLKAKGIGYGDEKANLLKVGNVVFPPLENNIGSYQESDRYTDLYGHQIILNYRPYRRLEDIAQHDTLMNVLNGDIKPDFVKDRIVLIGYDEDAFSTPYPVIEEANKKTPGVFIHAQMVSQIIDVALQKRSLISFLPPWGDTLFVWSWSLVGGTIVWSFRKVIIIGITKAIALGFLYTVCWGILLIKSGWVSFIPCAFALVLTGVTAIVFTELKANKLGRKK